MARSSGSGDLAGNGGKVSSAPSIFLRLLLADFCCFPALGAEPHAGGGEAVVWNSPPPGPGVCSGVGWTKTVFSTEAQLEFGAHC